MLDSALLNGLRCEHNTGSFHLGCTVGMLGNKSPSEIIPSVNTLGKFDEVSWRAISD